MGYAEYWGASASVSQCTCIWITRMDHMVSPFISSNPRRQVTAQSFSNRSFSCRRVSSPASPAHRALDQAISSWTLRNRSQAGTVRASCRVGALALSGTARHACQHGVLCVNTQQLMTAVWDRAAHRQAIRIGAPTIAQVVATVNTDNFYLRSMTFQVFGHLHDRNAIYQKGHQD